MPGLLFLRERKKKYIYVLLSYFMCSSEIAISNMNQRNFSNKTKINYIERKKGVWNDGKKMGRVLNFYVFVWKGNLVH